MSEEIKSLKDYISTTKNKIFTTFKIETISNLIIYYEDLHQKVEQLEKENEYLKMSNPEQNMEHFRIVNENKRKIDMLRKENHQLEKENIKQKEIIENLTTMTVCGDKKQIKNTAQYKLEQLENIRKDAIEELSYMSTDAYVEDYDIREKHYNLLMNILNKGSESNV